MHIRHQTNKLYFTRLYIAKIGTGTAEYDLIGRAKVATKVCHMFASLQGKIIRIQNVKYNYYKGNDRLELMDNFHVETDVGQHTYLRQQTIRRQALTNIVNQQQHEKISLWPCLVSKDSISKIDVKGRAYRKTRLVDAKGIVININIWGDLAQKEKIWEKDSVIDIYAASVNKKEKRKIQSSLLVTIKKKS